MQLRLALALAGGLILNVMPCVLPVLALKAFHAVEHSKHDARKRRMHGWAYTAGTVSLFVAFALVLVLIKASGKRLGWGMQFQHPPFVAVMTAIVFAFALNALGVMRARAAAGLAEKLLADPAPAVPAAAAVALYRITGKKAPQFPAGYDAD